MISFARLGTLFSYATAFGFVAFSIYLYWLTGEYFRPIVGIVSGLFLLFTHWFVRRTDFTSHVSAKMSALVEFSVGLLLALNGFGALGWYLQFQYYDLVLHFIDPLIISFLISVILQPYYPKKRRYIALGVIAATVALVFIWEGWEYFGDAVFGTAMAGQPGEELDTLFDIVAGFFGLSIGSAAAYFYHKK